MSGYLVLKQSCGSKYAVVVRAAESFVGDIYSTLEGFEFGGFSYDPREAARIALYLLEGWQRCRGDLKIDLVFGDGSDQVGGNNPRQALLKWANRECENIPQCVWCGIIVGDDLWYGNDSDLIYCSKTCANLAGDSAVSRIRRGEVVQRFEKEAKNAD